MNVEDKYLNESFQVERNNLVHALSTLRNLKLLFKKGDQADIDEIVEAMKCLNNVIDMLEGHKV